MIGLCLTADDLARALSHLPGPVGADKLDLMVLAMQSMGKDALVCRQLQSRLDELAVDWLALAGGQVDNESLASLWDAGCRANCAAAVYWTLMSLEATSMGLRRRLFRELGARYLVPQNDDHEGSAISAQRVSEIVRMSANMLEGLKREQERGEGLAAALQIESALRRQSQRRLDELAKQMADGARPGKRHGGSPGELPGEAGSAEG